MSDSPSISAEVQGGAFQGALPRGAEVHPPYIGDAPACTCTDQNGAAEKKPELIRILLSRSASEALTATGERAFAIVSRAMRGTEAPETAGRWEITLTPIEWDTARDAAAVLTGEKRAAKLSTKKS